MVQCCSADRSNGDMSPRALSQYVIGDLTWGGRRKWMREVLNGSRRLPARAESVCAATRWPERCSRDCLLATTGWLSRCRSDRTGAGVEPLSTRWLRPPRGGSLTSRPARRASPWRWRAEQRRRSSGSVSYTHLRAHETRHDLVCRLLLEKK